jgi:hypothetical protein
MTDKNADKTRDGLLEALESLRSVLDRGRQTAAAAAADLSAGAEDSGAAEEEERVPLLDDVVDGAIIVDEAPLHERASMATDSGGLNDELFSALLTDGWKASAEEILRESRADIEAHRARWLPEDTDRLNSALKERIDETMRGWIREVLRRNINELHGVLLAAIEEQLREQIAATLEDPKDRRRR